MKRCVVWVLTILLLAVLCGESFADTRCSNCGGTGKTEKKCGSCSEGKCPSCRGRGTKYKQGGYVTCDVCRGSKKCNVCHGNWKKTETCVHCGGKGYISSSPSSGGNSNPSSGGNSGGGSSGGSEGTDYDSIITTINETNFPDDVFREYVKSNFDNDSDGYLRTSEIASAHTIDVNSKGISSLKGIEYFTSLWDLNCSNNQLTELDVSKCTGLDSLSCSGNQLTELDVRKNTTLKYLSCSDNQLTELDVSNNKFLWNLDCSNNQLTTLTLIMSYSYLSTGLRTLACSNNQLTELDVNNCANLTELDVSNNPALTKLAYGYCTKLTTLDVSNNTALTDLYCSNKQLTTLNVRGCTNLEVLSCSGNQLTELDVSTNTALTELWCSDNQLTELDVRKNTTLKYLSCSDNQLTELDVRKNTALTYLYCENNQLTTLDVSKNTALTKLWCSDNQLTTLDVSTNTALNSFSHDGGVLIITDTAEINETNFPDAAFREYVRSNFDKNSNDYLDATEIANTTSIHVNNKGISSLKGIEYFIVLTSLKCSNNKLTALDVSKNTALTELYCENNQLAEINISNSTALTELYCSNNQLTKLDVSKNTALTTLWCGSNQLTTLDVSKNTALTTLACYNNKITELDVSKNTALTWLSCEKNQLAKLDVSKCTALTWLDCNSNQLTKLDVSGCTQLESLYCSNNKLTELDVRKNTALTTLYCENNQLTDSNTILIISPETFPDGKVGTDYSATLSANLSGVTWSATDLPSWLSLNASTGELSGKPTTGGSYTFTVTASLSSLSVQKIYTLTISSGSGGGDTGTEEDPVIVDPPRFDSANLTLTGQIAVNFYMELPENPGVDYDDGKTCYTEFDINGKTTDNNPQTVDRKFTDKDGYYGFKCYVTSIQMADPITATFYYGDGKSVQQSYSVKRYLDNMINRSTTSTEMKNLAVAIKNYGHYAQIYLDRVNIDWELGKDHVALEAASDYTTEDIANVKSAVAPYKIASESYSGSGIKTPSYSLNLDSETTINLTFTMYDDFTGDLHAYLNGGTTDLAVKQTDGTYRVRITNIAAHELADTQTVKICVGNDNNYAGKEFTIKSSGLTFVYTSLYGSYPEDRQKLAVAFYKYYEATVAYRNAK